MQPSAVEADFQHFQQRNQIVYDLIQSETNYVSELDTVVKVTDGSDSFVHNH